MRIDDSFWDPIGVNELAAIFSKLEIPWWISGGWALDLFLGGKSREHEDTDILVLRKDQSAVRELLKGWSLFKTKSPGLAPWPEGEYLDKPINCFWVRPDNESAWAFEVMLQETEGDEWVYRRLTSIRGKVADMGLETDSGIPYVRPEIQLLYKSGPNREKDFGDLKRILPHLPPDKIEWLLNCLRMQYTGGHQWIDYIEGFLAE